MSPVIEERRAAPYAAATAEQTMERLARAARPDAVFGQPIERGEITVIPCCEVALGMGMGGGTGTGPTSDKTRTPGGEGLGAGGGARGRPVANIVITRDAVRVVPIYDVTKVALAGLTTAGFIAFWLARLVSAQRARRARPGLARTLAVVRRMPRAR